MLGLWLFSCSDELKTQSYQIEDNLEANSNIYYPITNIGGNKKQLRAYNINEWETWQTIKLPSGAIVTPPWSNGIVNTAIPEDIRKDVSPKNGWDMIVHTLDVPDIGSNYILFHNKFTGVLKVFYYLENNSPNNTGIWKSIFTNNYQTLFFQDYYALPSSTKYKSGIPDNTLHSSNISQNDTKGFTPGWNCYEVELSYNPYFNTGNLEILPYSLNNSTVSYGGSLEMYSSGAIITRKSNESSLGTLSKSQVELTGNKAISFLQGLLGGEKGKFITDFLTNPVSGALKLGVDKLGGILSKNDSTVQSLRFSTDGTMIINGTVSTPETVPINNMSIPINNNLVGTNLGAWNLERLPIIYLDPYAEIYPKEVGLDEQERRAKLKADSYVLSIGNVQINPNIRQYITRYSIYTNIYGMGRGYINLPAYMQEYDLDFGDLQAKPSQRCIEDFSDNDIGFIKDGITYYNPSFDYEFDILLTLKEASDDVKYVDMRLPRMYMYSKFGILPVYIVEVTLKMETSINGNNNTVTSTKVFIPNIQWSKDY